MPDSDPDDVAEPRDTVLMSAEDGLADTIRPRLDAAVTDPTRVHALLEVVVRAGDVTEHRPPVLPDDLAQLEQLVADHDAALVIVDVLMAYLSADTNSYRDQDIRRVLAPLAAMAERRGCCVLMLRHLRKTSGGAAVYAGGGSIGIVGQARVGLVAAFDPDDGDLEAHDRRRVLAVTKCNIAPEAQSLSYRVVDVDGVGRIEWLGRVTHHADDLIASEHDMERADREQFLQELLRDGPVRSPEVERLARSSGFTVRQLRPALKRLGGAARRTGFGADGEWWWTLRPPIDDVDAHSQERGSTASMEHLRRPFDGMEDF